MSNAGILSMFSTFGFEITSLFNIWQQNAKSLISENELQLLEVASWFPEDVANFGAPFSWAPGSFEALNIEKVKGLNLNFNLAVTKDAVAQVVIDKVSGSDLKGSGNGNLNIEIEPTEGTTKAVKYIIIKMLGYL